MSILSNAQSPVPAGESPELLTRTEAARLLRISVPMLERDAQDNRLRIPLIRIGRRCLYPRQALQAWLEARLTANTAIVAGSDF